MAKNTASCSADGGRPCLPSNSSVSIASAAERSHALRSSYTQPSAPPAESASPPAAAATAAGGAAASTFCRFAFGGDAGSAPGLRLRFWNSAAPRMFGYRGLVELSRGAASGGGGASSSACSACSGCF